MTRYAYNPTRRALVVSWATGAGDDTTDDDTITDELAEERTTTTFLDQMRAEAASRRADRL